MLFHLLQHLLNDQLLYEGFHLNNTCELLQIPEKNQHKRLMLDSYVYYNKIKLKQFLLFPSYDFYEHYSD